MTAGGATTTAREKQAAAVHGGEARPGLPFLARLSVHRAPLRGHLLPPKAGHKRERGRGRGLHGGAWNSQGGHPRLTLPQVHASLDVPLLLVHNFSLSPGEKKI